MRLLTVDDDPIFQEVLRGALAKLGETDVTEAGSAREALCIIDSDPLGFDCFLLDIQMPVTNGIELCAVLRAREGLAHTPIVMITSMGAKAYIDDAFAAGATDYVTKPIDMTDLKARMGVVRQLIDERQRMLDLADAQAAGRAQSYEFEYPVPLRGLTAVIDFVAMQNYFNTLGKKTLMTTPVLACRIDNAATLYAKARPGEFENILGDVAMTIFDSLKRHQVMISYAGSGLFFCAINNLSAVDTDLVKTEVNAGLADFQEVYAEEHLPLPRVSVGEPVRSSFFSLGRPDAVFEKAARSISSGPDSGLPTNFASVIA